MTIAGPAPYPMLPLISGAQAEGVTAADLLSLFDGALDAIVLIDTQSIVLGWNRSAEQTFGFTRDEAVGAAMSELLIPARFREAHHAGMKRFLETGHGPLLNSRIEVAAMHKAGHEFPCELTILPLSQRGGLRFCAFLRDISERIESQRKLARRALEAQVLNEVSTLVGQGGSPEEGLRLCMGKICELADWSAGHCYLPDDRVNPTRLLPSGVWSFRDADLEALAGVGSVVLRRGEGLPGRIWQTGSPEWIIDVGSDPTFLRGPAYVQAGITSAFGFPVFTEGHLEAVLEFFSTEERRPEPELMLTVGSLSEQLGRLLERQRAFREQRLLMRELAHRVGNTLSIVNAVFRRTARNAGTKEELADRFEQRLQAVSSAHRLLCDGNWGSTSLLDLVHETLQPYTDGFANCSISGPAVSLSPRLTMALNLVLHELATNAAKYGAFSAETGRVALDWELDSEAAPTLTMRWVESGGPPVHGNPSRGFGSQLIDMMVRQVDGRQRIELAPDGLRAELHVPLHAGSAEMPPSAAPAP